MRRRTRRPMVLALPAAAVLVALSAAPALAAGVATPTFPTTPVPTNSPGEPPVSSPNGSQPLGHAVGVAATGLAVLRLAPGAVPANSILPGAANQLPRQSAAELGFGLSSAQANSESFLNYERAIASSAPAGVAIEGNSPQLPGALTQTALPDNAKPVSGGLTPPSTPLDALLKVGLLQGQVHARWSPTLGPCVGTIADASTSVASISALNIIPSLPATTDSNSLSQALSTSNLAPAQLQALINNLSQLSGPLSSLGGLLSGGVTTGGTGSLVSLPNILSSRSVVQLVSIPGSANKAVQSVSTLQVAALKLFAGTPIETDLNVVSQPTLTVTSTGSAATSTVSYKAPVIQVVQAGKVLYTLDAANPTADIPIGIPLNVPNLPKLPIVGDLLPNGQQLTSGIPAIDIGVVRVSIAELAKTSEALTGGQNGAPFTGFQLGATARMLDLQVLPTKALGIPNLPTALAEVSLGEQNARAYAPTGGVKCGTAPAGTPPIHTASTPPTKLAFTNGAYDAVPLFWLGTGMLLVGVIVVASLPGRVTRGKAR